MLIANAEDNAAMVRATYLLEAGESFSETFNVTAHSRYTIDVKSRDSRLLSTPVSVVIESTNNVPLVVERAMWWPHGNWYEASLSAGVTATGTKWAMAEGEQQFQRSTYVLIANTDPANAGTATVTLMDESGVAHQITKTLPANSRTTVDVGAEFPGIANKRFGIIVKSNGVPIVVERSMYDTPSRMPMWSAGGTSVATNITPIP